MSTPLPNVGRVNERLRKLPHYRTMTSSAGGVSTVEALLNFLDAYALHAERELEKLRETAREGSRSSTVLRGLRQDLANVVSTLQELDVAACPLPEHDPTISGYCSACGVRLVDDVPSAP